MAKKLVFDSSIDITDCCLLYPEKYYRIFEQIVAPFLENSFNLNCSILRYEKIDRKIIQSIRDKLKYSCIFIFCYSGEIKLEYSYKLGLAHAYDRRVILINFRGKNRNQEVPKFINHDFLIEIKEIRDGKDVDFFVEEVGNVVSSCLSKNIYDFLYRKALKVCDAFEREVSCKISRVDRTTFSKKFNENQISECLYNYDRSLDILLFKVVEDVKMLGLSLRNDPSSFSFMDSTATGMKIFVSYSHQDSEWLDKLQIHLRPLIRNQTIELWDDTCIRPGDEWLIEIQTALAVANIAILLVSPNFLASDFIYNNELHPLFGAAQVNGVRIVWIPISFSSHEEMGFSRYQAAHNPSQPLDTLPVSEQNRILVRICAEIRRIATE